MKSLFVTGTDTNIGKTYISAGLVVTLKKLGLDVGVMKPFAAGIPQKSGFKSEDVEILAKFAQVDDPETLLNPQFFPISASPYTASQKMKIKPNIPLILKNFEKLSKLHSTMVVEGIGGLLTPIRRNYFVSNLINDLKLSTIIVTSSKIGTINHTLLTCRFCELYKIPVKGLIINNFDKNGYSIKPLTDDLEKLTNFPVLGTIPFINDLSEKSLYRIFKKNINFKYLLD